MSTSGTTADALREVASIIRLTPHLVADYITYNAGPDRGRIGIQISSGHGRSDEEQIAEVEAWSDALGGLPKRRPTPCSDGVQDFYEFEVKIDRFTWHVYAALTTHVCPAVSA